MAKNKFQCPQCGVPIRANGKTGSMVCPACGFAIASAAAELGKADASNDLGINVIKYEHLCLEAPRHRLQHGHHAHRA